MKMIKILSLSLLLISLSALGQELPTAENAWLRAAPPNAKMLAAYVQLQNNSDQTISLIGAQSDLFHMTEIHLTVEVDGVFKMREQKSLAIAAGETLLMEPGGLHIMLMMPQTSLELGQMVDITLVYETEDGDQIEQSLPFEVKKER